MGWLGDKPYRPLDSKLTLFTLIATDLQLLFGLALYFILSPQTSAAFANFGAAMKSKPLRFWAVEHITIALVAVMLVHVGRIKARKVEDSRDRHKRIAIYFGLALVAVLVAIPWPFRQAIGRALFFGM